MQPGGKRKGVTRYGTCFACVELELELIQTQMAQKPMLRVEVGARALRDPVGGGGDAARVFACVVGLLAFTLY